MAMPGRMVPYVDEADAREDICGFIEGLQSNRRLDFKKMCVAQVTFRISGGYASIFFKNGGVAALFHLLSRKKPEQIDDTLRELIANALTTLMSQLPESRAQIARQKELTDLLKLIEAPDIKVKKAALRAVSNLAIDEQGRTAIINKHGLPKLVALLKNADLEIQETVLHTLANMTDSVSRIAIAKEGAIPCVLTLLDSGVTALQRTAAKVLASLAEETSNCLLIGGAGGVMKLIPLLSHTNQEVRVVTAFALNALALGNPSHRAAIEAAGCAPVIEALRSTASSIPGQIITVTDNTASRVAGVFFAEGEAARAVRDAAEVERIIGGGGGSGGSAR